MKCPSHFYSSLERNPNLCAFFMCYVQIVIPLIKNMSSQNNSILSHFCTRVVMEMVNCLSKNNTKTTLPKSVNFSHVLCRSFLLVFQFASDFILAASRHNRSFISFCFDSVYIYIYILTKCPFELSLPEKSKQKKKEKQNICTISD